MSVPWGGGVWGWRVPVQSGPIPGAVGACTVRSYVGGPWGGVWLHSQVPCGVPGPGVVRPCMVRSMHQSCSQMGTPLTPEQNDRQKPVKTLLSHNFVGER